MKTVFDSTDISILARETAVPKRAGAAQRICERMVACPLRPTERALAERLLRLIADDAACLVRAALVVTLHNSPDLPRDVAVKLAADVDTIAVPILRFSPVLTDADIVSVLRSGAAAKTRAAANRARVSSTVARSVVRFGDSAAVADLAANDGADIDEGVAREMVRLWHEDDLITETMIARRDMPIDVLELLVAHTSAETALALQDRGVAPHVADDIALRARERATVEIARTARAPSDVELLVDSLHREGRLNGSVVLRAICAGQMPFAELALARLAAMPLQKARLLLHDPGPYGVGAICGAAGLSGPLHAVVGTAMRLYADLLNRDISDAKTFARRLAERLATGAVELPARERAFVMERLDRAWSGPQSV